MPLVSVLMTAYNREKFIAEAIKSVLVSDYGNFELIIVDDCSNDHTFDIAEDFKKHDARISIYRNEKNLGQFTNRNKAASYAKGYYILYVDSDDVIFPDVISRCVKEMEHFSDNNFGMAYDEDQMAETKYIDKKSAIQENFFGRHFLGKGPGSTIMRLDFFKSIGGYTDKYGAVGDMYFNLKAVSHSGVVLLPIVFVYYRRHEQQEINNPYSYLYNSYRYFKDALVEIDMHLTHTQIEWLGKKNKRRFVTNIFKYFKKSRNLKQTMEAIKKAEFKALDFFQGIFH